MKSGRRIDKFLVVKKERILMENVGDVKEMWKVNGKMENSIDEMETIKTKIEKIKRIERIKYK
jgi:hypothetical protein